jgi:hypothetical protein
VQISIDVIRPLGGTSGSRKTTWIKRRLRDRRQARNEKRADERISKTFPDIHDSDPELEYPTAGRMLFSSPNDRNDKPIPVRRASCLQYSQAVYHSRRSAKNHRDAERQYDFRSMIRIVGFACSCNDNRTNIEHVKGLSVPEYDHITKRPSMLPPVNPSHPPPSPPNPTKPETANQRTHQLPRHIPPLIIRHLAPNSIRIMRPHKGDVAV